MDLIEMLFVRFGVWTWWLLGLGLLILELAVPGQIFIWFGVAALAVGAIGLFEVWDYRLQLLVWGALSVVLLLIGRHYFRRTGAVTEDPLLNDRGGRLIGREFTLVEPIVEGAGKLKVDDSIWRLTGPNLAAGTRVKVVSSDGPLLKVDKA